MLQTDLSSLVEARHDPATVDYVLGAALLANHLGGEVHAIEAWVQGATGPSSGPRARWRAQLSDAFKLRNGEQMVRVAYVAQRQMGVELSEAAVQTYCVQVGSGKYTKQAGPSPKNRMLVGELAHFEALAAETEAA